MIEEQAESAEEDLDDTDDLLPAEELYDEEFVPFRIPVGSKAKLLVNEAIRDLLEDEARRETRTRRRRAADQITFEATVSALLCDAVYRELIEPGSWIMITFDKSVLGCGGRYRARALNTKFPDIVKALTDRNWIELELGYQSNPFMRGNPSKRTRIRAGDTLRRCWMDGGLRLADFDLEDSEEVIILRGRRLSHRQRGVEVDYVDTESTHRYRGEIRRINAFLRSALLAFRCVPEGRRRDLGLRRLRRIFNDGSFESGGRLNGGFWQHISSQERLTNLTISGSPIVSLDYGQTALRILYGMAKVTPQWTDGYVVPGLEGHREGVKKLLNSVLNRDTPITRYPAGQRSLFPPTIPLWKAVRMIEEFHPPVRDLWRPRLGMELMFRESTILIEVLLRLIDLDIVALPVHDAVLVAEQHEEITKATMEDVFLRHTSVSPMVGVCRGSNPKGISPQVPHM